MSSRKKLIEVALPLEAINKASAREKAIRRGHPSTLCLWLGRRALATAQRKRFAECRPCRLCGEPVPSGHRHGSVCHGCGACHLGVVH